MNPLTIILGIIIIIAALAFLAMPAMSRLAQKARITGLALAANALPANVGTHCKAVSRYADAAIATKNLLLKKGSDAMHVAICGAADKPLGFCRDAAEAAEDEVSVNLFGAAEETQLGVAAGAITVDAQVYAAASGKVQALPTAAGAYWCVGRALTATGAANDPIEIDPCEPYKVVVLAAGTSTNGTAAAAADLAALKAETEKVGDDVRALRQALEDAGILSTAA